MRRLTTMLKPMVMEWQDIGCSYNTSAGMKTVLKVDVVACVSVAGICMWCSGGLDVPCKTASVNPPQHLLTALLRRSRCNLKFGICRHIVPSVQHTAHTCSCCLLTPSAMLLQNVWGRADPGDMLALMGPSGAGKSTLMDILAGRKSVGNLTGAVLVNGRPRKQAEFARKTAYVPQVGAGKDLNALQQQLVGHGGHVTEVYAAA